MSNLITSLASVDVDGIGILPVKSESTELRFSQVTREPVMGDSGLLGNTEKHSEPAMIKVTVVDSASFDLQKLRDYGSGRVTLITNSGKSFVLTSAYVSNQIGLNVSSGEVEVEFHGAELIQQ